MVLRDAHQSILATRVRLEDMLPIAAKLDQVGFWSVESWGGATFDACIRYLGEDPWERIRELKKVMPNTRQQMLLRGQNLLGYRHYADDVVEKFVERAAVNGVDVFRVFDAMNDPRNLKTALRAVKQHGKHAQGTISYTTSPVHTLEMWVDLAKQIEDMGADSVAIMTWPASSPLYGVRTGLAPEGQPGHPDPYAVPRHCRLVLGGYSQGGGSRYRQCRHCHLLAVNDLWSFADRVGGGHVPRYRARHRAGPGAAGRDCRLLREVRKKYAKFEGNLKGVDSRILVAQVPGGMLTNMESQLKEQGAQDKFDQVLAEIPRVREDLGFIPLVTPTSQIVGTQAVINVLTGERYKSITKETAGVLKGEYGAAPAPFNAELQARVLDGAEVITCRPADLCSRRCSV